MGGSKIDYTQDFVREVMRCAAEGFVYNGKVYVPDVDITIDGKGIRLFKRGSLLGSLMTRLDMPDAISLKQFGVCFMVECATTPGNYGDAAFAALGRREEHVVASGEWDGLQIIDHGDGQLTIRDGDVRLRVYDGDVDGLIEALTKVSHQIKNRKELINE